MPQLNIQKSNNYRIMKTHIKSNIEYNPCCNVKAHFSYAGQVNS